MATRGSQPYVQTRFTDQPGIGYAGEIEFYQGRVTNNHITQFWTPSQLMCGTGVVKGQAQNFNNGDASVRQATTAIAPYVDTTTPLTEDDFIGVVFRQQYGTFPFEYVIGEDDDSNDIVATYASYRERRIVPIIPKGFSTGVYITQLPTIGDVTSGDSVYMVLTSDAVFSGDSYNLLPGQFVNIAADTAAHTLEITSAFWKYSRDGGDSSNRALDPINTIIFA